MKHNNYLDKLNTDYPIRKTEEEKEKFRAYVHKRASVKGAVIQTEHNGNNKNIVIGDAEQAKVIFTAHYDTPAKSVFPNIMIPRNKPLFFAYQFGLIFLLLAVSIGVGYLVGMVGFASRSVFFLTFLVLYYGLYFRLFRFGKNPHNYNDNTSGVATLLTIWDGLDSQALNDVAFIFFDNEEKGKKGSKAYFAEHKTQMQNKLLVNFDCVGNGNNIVFIAQENAEQLPAYPLLKESFTSSKAYKVAFYPIKGSECNSDHKNFPCGVGCMACKTSKKGVLYTPYIHTPKDVCASEENIMFLSQKAIAFVQALQINERNN